MFIKINMLDSFRVGLGAKSLSVTVLKFMEYSINV